MMGSPVPATIVSMLAHTSTQAHSHEGNEYLALSIKDKARAYRNKKKI